MRPRNPVGCGLLLLGVGATGVTLWATGFVAEIPERFGRLAEHSGPLGVAVGAWSVLLLAVAGWAVTALGEPGRGRFPPRFLDGMARGVVGSGALVLLLGIAWVLLGGPGRGSPHPYGEGPDGPLVEGLNALAAGALAGLLGLAAAAWFLLLDAVYRARRPRGNRSSRIGIPGLAEPGGEPTPGVGPLHPGSGGGYHAGGSMGATFTMADVRARHRFTVEEYHRMAESGVFAPDARTELIDGEILEMSPIGVPHAMSVKRLLQAFAPLVGRAVLSVQDPVTLPDDGEPVPDFVLARPPLERYSGSHPHAKDVLLLVEVADSSLPFDRTRKSDLYARTGIVEYWIVNVVAGVIEVHRGPGGQGYAEIFIMKRGERLAPLAFPDFAVCVDAITSPSESASPTHEGQKSSRIIRP